MPSSPAAEFAEFGEVEVRKLTKVQRWAGSTLARNWTTIPHVTHHDEIDVTAAERRRAEWNQSNPGSKVTPVALLIKALGIALREHPQFNASLATDGQSLVFKKYFNVGVAVDTPLGILVPVVRDVNQLSLGEVAAILSELADNARTKGLSLAEMSGSSISLTSLGHIGGTAFTPIINAPDVAILGATAMFDRPKRGPEGSIVWSRMLPLSLSYDHRVINGADAARFVHTVGKSIAGEALFA